MYRILELIRWKNLLFIILIQWLMMRCIIYPMLQKYGLESGDSFFNSGYLLMLSTILIAAGGYIINDYFDVKIDRINKPDKVIITEAVTKEKAMRFYQILTGLGVIGGLVLAFLTKSLTLGFIFLLAPGLLWFYSASYKRQFISGNIVVSFLSALTIISAGILSMSLLEKEYHELINQTPIPSEIFGWMSVFALFAFITTWIREIIKDIQDEPGDREMECRTMPIKMGVQKTKYFLYVLIILVIGLLLFFNFRYSEFPGTFTLKYIVFGIIVPFLVLGYQIFKSKTKEEFKQASALTKYIMLIGVLYSVMYYYLLCKTYGLHFFGLFLVRDA